MSEKLDGLPLALATAGAYLGLTSIPVSEYLHHHKTSWLELQRTSPKLPSYEDRTIYSTWNLSYNHIRNEDESAAKLIELWGYFGNQDLWYDLLKAGNDKRAPAWFDRIVGTKLAFQAAIGKLQKHALVERLTESDGYSMHHCVHAWVKNVLGKTLEDQNMRLALTCMRKSVPIGPAPGDWMIKQRVFPHFERCSRLLDKWIAESKDSKEIEDCVTLFYRMLGILYRDHSRWTEAETMYQRALDGLEKAYGQEHIYTLNLFNSLGILYHERDELTKAESMYQRALTGKEKVLEKEHTSILNTINNLGILYNKQGKLTEAESMYQRALLGYTRDPPSNAKSAKAQLDLFYNMGLLSRDMQNFERAKDFFRQAHEGYQKLLGSEKAETIGALDQLNIEIERSTREAEGSSGEAEWEHVSSSDEEEDGEDRD